MIASKGQILLCAAKQGLFSVISLLNKVCWGLWGWFHSPGRGSRPGHCAHWSQSHHGSSLQEIQVASLRFCAHLLLLRAGFPLPLSNNIVIPRHCSPGGKGWNAVKIKDINKGTLISCFVFRFFRFYFISIQKRLLLTSVGASACGLFFKASLLYHFYVM